MFSKTTWSSSLSFILQLHLHFLDHPSVLVWTMATGNKGRQLPKFGEWDASNPASAQGFTVIFNQARDDKKTKKTAVAGPESLVTPPVNVEPQRKNNLHNKRNPQTPREKRKWLCFC